jgi:hypothetical protein
MAPVWDSRVDAVQKMKSLRYADMPGRKGTLCNPIHASSDESGGTLPIEDIE